MRELVEPAVQWRSAWLEAHAEWGPGLHEDGFGLSSADDVESEAGFAAWVRSLRTERRATFRWVVEDGQVLGGIALRHESHAAIDWAGHIGFGIRPSARRRGVASWAVREMVAVARSRGLQRVLLVCVADNAASAKTIEAAGGVLEDVRDRGLGPARRYWITTEPTISDTTKS